MQSCPQPEQQPGHIWEEVAQQVRQLREALQQRDQAHIQDLMSTMPSLIAQLEAMARRGGAGAVLGADQGDFTAFVGAVRSEIVTCRQMIADELAVIRWELRSLGSLHSSSTPQEAGAASACRLDLRV